MLLLDVLRGYTLIHDSSKHIDPTWRGGAVPAAIPELMLTLN